MNGAASAEGQPPSQQSNFGAVADCLWSTCHRYRVEKIGALQHAILGRRSLVLVLVPKNAGQAIRIPDDRIRHAAVCAERSLIVQPEMALSAFCRRAVANLKSAG